ncbi:ThiF family adenylyltransferase [Nocardia elegans]|uniref:ThiF family adenylyltransferase n=1 Tax=Nocardia elegans TaxID=300029 RepID=UPI001893F73F|nr:ThiF family adenylyltransferase [Nocardia elegans]MBF6446598.1 ThiF family adenylyltransferase [Nocardia elegans]
MIRVLHPEDDAVQIAELLATGSGYTYIDGWDTALTELAVIERPELAADTAEARRCLDEYAEAARGDGSIDRVSRFIVYPWRRTIVKLPDSEHFWRLRTARNRHLLTPEEQRKWSDALVGVAGLSVGASALAVCALTGARRFRLAERDTLGPTNLNRLQASVCDLGQPKLALAARRTLELDPYSEITSFPDGYSPTVAGNYLGDSTLERLSVLIEEMDDLAMKVDIRKRARSQGIPVIMVTDHGDNVLIDVERYDLDPAYPLFHGSAGDLTNLSVAELNDRRRRIELVSKIVGLDVTPQTRYSLTEVGKTLPSWPQLGTAVTLAGAIAAAAARLIVCGAPVTSGRYRVDADKVLIGSRGSRRDQWNELTERQFAQFMDRLSL